jgi:hypothetical protein
MNKQQLAMLEDISNKLEKRTSDQGARGKNNEANQDGGMYNPIVHLELSQFKKHNSLAPLRKDASNIEYNKPGSDEMHKGEFIVIKSKKKEEPSEKPKDKKSEVDADEAKKRGDNDSNKHDSSETLKKIEKFLDSTPVILFMTTLTLFALFASDIQASCLSQNVDIGFDITQIFLLFFFTLEVVLSAIAKKNYVGTFFFWLDVIATISLIQDITLIFDNLLTGTSSLDPPISFSNVTMTTLNVDLKSKSNTQQAAESLQKISSASRATRVLRIIRIIRLIRMVKLYKSAVLARANMERRKKEKERMKSYNQMMDQMSYEESKSRNSEGHDPINAQDGEINSPDKKPEAEPSTVVRLKDGHHRKGSTYGGTII